MYILPTLAILRRSLLHRIPLRSVMTTSVPLISRKDLTYLRQDEASKIDEELFSKYGFKVEQLMELAGLACAKAVHAQYSKGKTLVLCGPGNNGGDGFVCARHLQQFGFDPVILYPKPSKTDLMNALVTQCTGMGIPVLSSLPTLSEFSLIVDAFFGFSFKPPVREPFAEIIEAVTKSGIFVFSIDIPSGWHVENGPPSEGPYIHPHGIISLTAPKLCVRDWTGPHFVGGRFVPKQLAKEHGLLLPKYPNADQIVKCE
uniref:NAD(P)H-hydrate epimerase n=1 Tax=Haemonchus contortus TaxID=6289 RepID=A0A7I4Y151_HAECO|nr:YjeF-related protein domain containing protein [Haemonchus contortus]